MRKFSTIALIVSIVSFLIGFSGIGSDMVTGLAKAVGAVLFIVFYVGKIVPADETY